MSSLQSTADRAWENPGGWSHDAFQYAAGVYAGEQPAAQLTGVALPWRFQDDRGIETWRMPPNGAFDAWGALQVIQRFDAALRSAAAWAAKHRDDRREVDEMKTRSLEERRFLLRQIDEREHRDRDAAHKFDHHGPRAITEALVRGLRARVGQKLAGDDLNVFVQLAARAGESPEGVRVCEGCNLVFEAPCATRCPAHLKTTGRFKIQPHHTDARWIRGKLTYFFECAECGRSAYSNHALTKYCAQHATPAARLIRHRAA